MTILVTGATGTVGSQVVRALVERGERVRALTRSPEKAAALPAGVEAVTGDLGEAEGLVAAFAGADGVFLLTALGPDETRHGLNAVAAAEAAGVGRLVYMTVHRLEEGAHIPHFGSKIPVVRAIADSGLAHTFIAPNNFFQNDAWLREPIAGHGVYPVPIGTVGLHRVDVRDIADAAANALTGGGHTGRTYPVVGPEALTGPAVAAVYARALGRDVRYGGDDLDAWAEAARKTMPEGLVHDLRIMFAHFQAHGLLASEEDLAASREIVGHAPRDFESYVAELTRSWTA